MGSLAAAPSGPDPVIVSSDLDVAEVNGNSKGTGPESTHNTTVTSGLMHT